jgi:hypothetical protein
MTHEGLLFSGRLPEESERAIRQENKRFFQQTVLLYYFPFRLTLSF